MNCPGLNSATVDPVAEAHPADGADPAGEVHPAGVVRPVDEADPVVVPHPAVEADPVVVPHPVAGADPAVVAHPVAGADPADDPELPDRVVVAVLAGDLVSPARRDSSDVKLGIPRT